MTIPAFAPRVLEASSTTGTGSYTVTGAQTGDQTFAAGVANGAVVDYFAFDSTGAWEEGQGTLSSSNTVLSRAIIYGSSNGGAAVSWTASQNLRVGLTISSEYAKNCINNNGSNLTTNGVLYGTGNAVAASTAEGTDGTVLVGDTGSAPVWSASPSLTALTLSTNAAIGGSSLSADRQLNIGGTLTGSGTTQVGAVSDPTGNSSATASVFAFAGLARTAAAAFTCTELGGFHAINGVAGSGSTITNQYGFHCDDLTVGTNNYAFYSHVSAGANKYNLYMAGTAANYLAGTLTVGSTIAASNFSGSSSGANTGDQTTITGNAGTATALQTSRNLWGQAFNGTAAVTGSLTDVGNITGGASSMTILAGTGASRTLTLQTTTSGSVATTALTLGADQSGTFAGNVFLTGASNPTLRLAEGASTTGYIDIINIGTNNSRIIHTAPTGVSPLLDLDANPADGTSVASVRYGRNTNTSGAFSLQVFKGNGTATPNAQFGGNTNSYVCLDNGNLGIRANAWGTSAVGALAIGNGTEPTTSPADQIQIYSVDLSAGNATLGLRTETAVVTESVTSDRTLSVRINGTTYKICLKV